MPGTGILASVPINRGHAFKWVYELRNTTDCIVSTTRNVISLTCMARLTSCMCGMPSRNPPDTGYSAAVGVCGFLGVCEQREVVGGYFDSNLGFLDI